MNERPLPSAPTQILHVVTLSAFAVAQPIFDLLGRNASFFVAHRASRADVLLLSLAVLVGVPSVLLAARFAIGAVSAPAGRVAHLVIVGLLAAVAFGAPLVRATDARALMAVPLMIGLAAAAAVVYRRYAGVRRFVSVLTPAVVVFFALFVLGSQMRDVVFSPAAASEPSRRRSSDVPVLAVLFDELSVSSLITPDGDIDAERFPGFAKLAGRSTWYRNTTTAGLRTDQAVPAILTGRRAPTRQVPSVHAYPDNVFTLFRHSHDLRVHEFVTQLCPVELCPVEGADEVSGLGTLFADTAIVYGHLALPSDLSGRWLPPLGDRWAGFSRDAAGGGGGDDPVRDWLRTAIDERETQHEADVFARFLTREVQRESSKPQLSWLHAQLPHPPWRYLPDGTTYPAGDTTPGYRDFRWSDEQYLVNEVLQRSLLQTKLADLLVERMIDFLAARDLLDDLMIVVVSDHGATWEAGATRRDVDGPQGAGLLGVPLFVKYPGQSDGEVDDRPAETVDVLPTIADVTGIEVPWEAHGLSLRSDRTHDDRRVFDGAEERVVRYSFADSRERAAEIEDLFGPSGGPDDLYAFGPHRDLLGTEPVGLEEIPADFDPEPYAAVDRGSGVVPAFFRARVNDDLGAGVPVAVVVNGRIAGVGQTYAEDGATRVAVMLAPRYLRDGRNVVSVRRIE